MKACTLEQFHKDLRNFLAECFVPRFDPKDGGSRARVLLLLMDPGEKTKTTGMVSRDNPDDTARRLKAWTEEAGLARKDTVLWNAIPWFIERPPGQKKDKLPLTEGWPHLERLVGVLPQLQVVVLHGEKIWPLETRIKEMRPDLKVITTYHTGFRIYANPHLEPQIKAAYREVVSTLHGS